jgi:hypothetical protein
VRLSVLAVSLAVPIGLAAGSSVAAAATARPAAVTAGTSIGNAGQLTGTGSGTILSSSDDWWVIFPSSAGATVSVTADNNASNGTQCNVTATLEGTDGTAQVLTSVNVAPGGSNDLSGSAPSSDRYFVEVTPSNCIASAAYSLHLTGGGGGAAPAPAKGSIGPGASIGTAWPPLQGHSIYSRSINFSGGTEQWYVLFKKPSSSTASIRVQNTTVDGSTTCAVFDVRLFTNVGTSSQVVGSRMFSNAAVDLTVPASEPGDPQGRYYLEVLSDGLDCGGSGGATYTVEPESGTQFANPAKIPTGPSSPTPSIGGAWPPLRGGIAYNRTISFAGGTENWFVLFKKPDTHVASIRVENTTVDGSTSCSVFDVNLYTDAGTADNLGGQRMFSNSAAVLSVPAHQSGDSQGLFYLEVLTDGLDCGNSGGASYRIEPGPAAEFLGPAKPPSGKVTAASSIKKAWPPLHGGPVYNGSINFSGGPQNWYVLNKKADQNVASIRVANTTVDGSTSCSVTDVNLYSNAGVSGGSLGSARLFSNGVSTLSVPANLKSDPQGQYYLQFTSDGLDCGQSGAATYSIQAQPGSEFVSPALKVAGLTLKKGSVGKAYKATIGVSEGKAPYTFTAKSKLPPGLKLARHTGVVSGKPTKKGTYKVTVQISDSTKPHPKSVTDVFTITIG